MRVRERIGATLLVVGAVGATGCLAYRPSAPLDDAERVELDSIRERLLAREVRIVAPLESDWDDARTVLLAFEEVRLDVYRSVRDLRPGDVELELRTDARPVRGGSPWVALLSTLTLGLVPYVDGQVTSVPVRWRRADGAVRHDLCMEECPTLFAWVAPIVAMDEDWRLGGWPADGSPERRATLARLGFSLARRLDEFVGQTDAAVEAP